MQISAESQIFQVGKGTDFAGFEDDVHRRLPDILDRPQPKADGGRLPVPIFNREVILAGVYVRRQNLDAHAAAVGYIKSHFLDFIFRGGKQRGHILYGVMSLQVGGLYGNDAIISSMRLVKAVIGELFPVGKNGRSGLF